MLIGVRYALERGRGRTPVPVGSALLSTVLAVTALSATTVFGASLTRLISSPALYGAPYDVSFSNQGSGSGAVLTGALLHSLRRDPAIDRVTVASVAEINVNGRHVRGIAVTAARGPALISVMDGQLPRADHDIMLGAVTLRALGARAGGTVRVTVDDPVTGAAHTTPFRVTGRASFAPAFGTGGFGTGAALTVSALLHAQCPTGGTAAAACLRKAQQGLAWSLLVHAVPGRSGAAALARYAKQYPGFVGGLGQPVELINFGESVNFPLLFGAALSLFGAAALVHLLLVSVHRRRTEAGLLKVLGFVRRQIAAVTSWQATTVILAGLVVGVPLGIAAGKVAWRLFATNVGVVPVEVVQAVPLILLAAAALAAANLLAVLPALRAARSRPADLLRAE
jgi:hypothetical protein